VVLLQECDYRISPGEPCGLQQEQVPGVTSWPHILQGLRRLPVCTDGDAVGEWQQIMVPGNRLKLMKGLAKLQQIMVLGNRFQLIKFLVELRQILVLGNRF
jgi:hypothetical protein